MKRVYVRIVHAIRDRLVRLGWMSLLDAWAMRSRAGRWCRSLLAIFDIEALVELDTPWWTFASAELVHQHLSERPNARAFEWGSGASTVWLARRAKQVTAVEHDPDWAAHVRPFLGTNGQVLVVAPDPDERGLGIRSEKPGFADLDFTDYVTAIDATDDRYDLIVIDGRAREACLNRALRHLADDGLIVFDNVDRRRYRDAIAATPDLEVLWTRGLTPALPYPTRTALLRRATKRG